MLDQIRRNRGFGTRDRYQIKPLVGPRPVVFNLFEFTAPTGVNFINVLRVCFSYVSRFSAAFSIYAQYKNDVRTKNSYVKC